MCLPLQDGEPSSDHIQKDRLPYHWCCLEAGIKDYCDLYFEKRPLANGTLYSGLTIGL